MSAKARVTRDEWLDQGLAEFGRAGRAGLRVERMARALRCSKSSFYWYFGSHRSFELAVIERWRARETQSIIDAAETQSSPVAKLGDVVRRAIAMPKSGDFLFHLRDLARRDKKVRTLLLAIETSRVRYVAGVLEELGQPRARARENADVLYDYYLGWYERRK